MVDYDKKRAKSVSVEEAVSKLKRRMQFYGFRHIRTAGRGILILLKTLIMAVFVTVLEFLMIYLPFGISWFFTAFVISNALLAAGAILEFRKGIKRKPSKDSILIGRSFRHHSESKNGDGSGRSVEVGIDGPHYIDYTHEPNPHVLINGSTSSGKTATMLSFAARASLVNSINFLMIDLNGENEEWAKSINANVWKVPKNFKINLFALNGLSKEERASRAVENLMVAARLTALQSTKVKSALLRFYLNGKEPSLFELWKALCGSDAGKANVLNQRLRAIQRVIGYEPAEFWDAIFKGNNLISLAGLNESEKTLAVYAITQRLTELFDRNPELNTNVRLMVVMDEAWQFLKRESEFEPHHESSMERILRLGRKYGFGLVLATQQIEDVPKVFINSCAILMLHQQREHTYYGREILRLGPFESAYLNHAGQGELLLMDRGAAQKGQWWSEYVKTERLSGIEVQKLAEKSAPREPGVIEEVEMPIETHDGESRKDKNIKEPEESEKTKKLNLPADMITPPQYAGLLAIYNNPKASSGELVTYIKARGWFTSPNTLYGAGGKPGILKNLINMGLTKEERMGYILTESGRKWVDSESLMANQADKLGSEDHKHLMRKMIKKLQNEFKMVIVSKEKHSFDILAFPINEKKHGLWDFSKAKGYEVQTSARKDSIEENVNKRKLWSTPIVWVSCDDRVMDEIKKQANQGDEFMEI